MRKALLVLVFASQILAQNRLRPGKAAQSDSGAWKRGSEACPRTVCEMEQADSSASEPESTASAKPDQADESTAQASDTEAADAAESDDSTDDSGTGAEEDDSDGPPRERVGR